MGGDRSNLRSGDAKRSFDRRFTLLIDHFHVAVDDLFAADFTFGSHGTAAGERIARPYLACKADFEQPHLACAGELSQASREASGGPHSLGKNRGNTGCFDEGLIVM